MNNYKFFTNPQTLEELRKQYKELAMKHHPDCGGSTADMQAINNEYDELFKLLKDKHTATQNSTTTAEQDTKYNQMFKNIINKIIHFEGCEIEIIGSWIWITGNTISYKEQLKELKFNWCNGKKAWTWHNDNYRKKSKKQYSLDDLRAMFDTEKIATKKQKVLCSAV